VNLIYPGPGINISVYDVHVQHIVVSYTCTWCICFPWCVFIEI